MLFYLLPVFGLNRVAQERGITVKFDSDIFENNNTNAIWRNNTDGTREVILNPNADTKRTLQSVITHELTHDFEGTVEYNELKELVLNYDKGNVDFENARKSLEDIYSRVYDRNSNEFQTLVENEAVADILGNKLGDQNFINSLTTEKPSTARKIYNWVIDKLNKINRLTGYRSEKIFWTDVKNKFENAYKRDYQKNNTNLKYSIQTDNKGNKYVKVDTDQNIFEGIDRKDYSKIAKMYIKDYLMGETQLSENDIAIIDKRSANKYTNPGKKQQNFDKKMKLTPELKNVLKIAQKDNVSSPTKDTSKYQNWEYYKFKFELSGKKFEGTINVGIDSNGNKHFYEINKIKELDDISGTSLNRSSNSSINSITPTNEDVNTTKHSMQKFENNTWQEYLDQNYKSTGMGQTIQDVKVTPTANKETSKVANNLETLYNSNESVGEANGTGQYRQESSKVLGNLDTRLQQEQKFKQGKTYTRAEYKQWEQTIRPIADNKLTREQKQLKNDIKRQYKKDIVFFDGNENDYNGGASLTNKNNIYINKNHADEFGINKIALHEVLESNIAHNPEIKNDIINPTIKTIIKDRNFQEQKNKFWEGQEGDIPNDYVIAKDILCDRFAELKSGENLDYDNVLTQETNMTIDFAIENFEKQLMNNSNQEKNNITPKNKILNPTEIANLKQDDANTTPKLKNKKYAKGNKQSSFFSNITEDSKFLNKELREEMSKEENIQYYKGITNTETLEKAYNKLQ